MVLSVIICSHNPSGRYLDETLGALKRQSLQMTEWELILVDNLSEPPLAERVDLGWHPRAKVIREEKPGLVHARLRGIREAQSFAMVFVDDDNILSGDYLINTIGLIKDHPNLGCLGAGVIKPEFEKEPDPELRPYLGELSLRTISSDHWSNRLENQPKPWGPGLVIIRPVADAYVRSVEGSELAKKLGRNGTILLSGEDDYFSYVAHRLNLGTGLFTSLKVTHLIPANRVSKDYLLQLYEAKGATRALLDMLNGYQYNNKFMEHSLVRSLHLMLRLRVSLFLQEIYGWWMSRRKSDLDREFSKAWKSGYDSARRDFQPRAAI